MQYPLIPHPASSCPAINRFTVEVTCTDTLQLTLSYCISGAIDELAFPDATLPVRNDALWQHSCFEAFIRTRSETAYTEFNFAPSRAWAAYHFADYRQGMKPADDISEPQTLAKKTVDSYQLQAVIALPPLSARGCSDTLCIGLSAVIEDVNGSQSFWALSHPTDEPDFHHSDSFLCEINAS